MGAKSVRCRLGLHKWVTAREPESGSGYLLCARCGKERSPDGPSIPPLSG